MNESVAFHASETSAPRRLNEVAEQTGSTIWVTLSRPEKANALDIATLDLLLATLEMVEHAPDARTLVFSGAGRHFCAGADLAALRAGGLELALACDVVLAAKSATFGDAHLANGLLPGGGSTARLPRTIGWQRAKWLILSAATIDAFTARDWGMVFDVVEDGELEAAALRLAQCLTHGDGVATQRAKRLLAMTGEQSMSASLEAEITTLEAHYHSSAFQSGIDRFFGERRHKTGIEPRGQQI